MKIALISNTHNELNGTSRGWLIKLLATDADAFVLAGSITRAVSLERTISPLLNSKRLILYVDGNTDHYHSSLCESRRIYKEMESKYLNFKYFDSEYKIIHGKVVYGGCGWTGFNNNETSKWECQSLLEDTRHIIGLKGATGLCEMEQMNRKFKTGLLRPKFDKVDLVISGFTPIHKKVENLGALYDYYYDNMLGLMQRKRVGVWCHGHDGSREETIVNNYTRVMSNCKGHFIDNTYTPAITYI